MLVGAAPPLICDHVAVKVTGACQRQTIGEIHCLRGGLPAHPTSNLPQDRVQRRHPWLAGPLLYPAITGTNVAQVV